MLERYTNQQVANDTNTIKTRRTAQLGVIVDLLGKVIIIEKFANTNGK